MENSVRSEKSKQLIIQAAFKVVARDGATRLTIDAIALEAGISKGGVLHHFRTKQAVLTAMLDSQRAYFAQFSRDYLQNEGKEAMEPTLESQIAVSQAAIDQPHSVALAILGAIGEQPSLLDGMRASDAERLAAITNEAQDYEMAIIRWMAARGLLWTSLFNLCPLGDEERAHFFKVLLDAQRWNPPAKKRKK